MEIKSENKTNERGDINDLNLTRKELQSLGTKIIADARPKKKRSNSINKKKRMSRKEYIENQEMKQKWSDHYGRNKW